MLAPPAAGWMRKPGSRRLLQSHEKLGSLCVFMRSHLHAQARLLASRRLQHTIDEMTPEPPALHRPQRGKTWAGWAAIAAAICVVIVYFAWDVAPSQKLFGALSGDSTYYSLLVKGFRSGHLSLPIEPAPGLLKLKDPYDPKQNAPYGMHDISFYRGKFYLYFGVTPAIVLCWPVAALTGHYMDDFQVVVLFATAGFLVSAFVLLRIRRRYFPVLGAAADVAAVLAAGLITMVPVLLRRAQVYEVAVSSAYAFFALYLLAVYESLHSKRRLFWLSVAGLCYGLAIGCRPNYVLGAASILVPVFLIGRPETGTGKEAVPGLVARACAAFLPLALVVSGLLLYNYQRFGSPLEFGQELALSGSDETQVTHFSLSYIWYNCRAYLFAPAQLSSYFPFVRVVSLPPPPHGHYGIEDPYGIIPNIPFALLAFLAPLACARRRALGAFSLVAATASLAVAALIFTFQFATNRYMVDFLPGIIALSVIGFWGLVERSSGPARRITMGVGWTLLVWSMLFNVFAAMDHNELLRINDAPVFHRLVHAFGWPRHIYDKSTGRTFGPLELTLKFPTNKVGQIEPLVVTGTSFLSDYLYVHYTTDALIRIGFEHAGYGGPVTKPLRLDYSVPHRLVVDMPPLYPPIGDPFFDGVPPKSLEAFSNRLRVWLDGDEVIDAPQEFHPPFRTSPGIGVGASDQAALGKRFTGDILSAVSTKADWNAVAKLARSGPLMILLEFPVGQAGGHEPIVTSGEPGKGDVLVVNYLDANHVTFALDHWGYGGPVSGPVEIKPKRRQTLEVRFGSFFPASDRPANVPVREWSAAGERLKLILDGHDVFDVQTSFYDAAADEVVVGRNSIGASSCVAEFSGRIFGSIRSDYK
jgi:hypothetical protein